MQSIYYVSMINRSFYFTDFNWKCQCQCWQQPLSLQESTCLWQANTPNSERFWTNSIPMSVSNGKPTEKKCELLYFAMYSVALSGLLKTLGIQTNKREIRMINMWVVCLFRSLIWHNAKFMSCKLLFIYYAKREPIYGKCHLITKLSHVNGQIF